MRFLIFNFSAHSAQPSHFYDLCGVLGWGFLPSVSMAFISTHPARGLSAREARESPPLPSPLRGEVGLSGRFLKKDISSVCPPV